MSYYAAFGRTVELLLNVFPGLGLGRYIHSEMEAKFKIGPGERFWKRRILSYIRDCSPRSSIEFLFLGASIQMHREQLASRSNAETNECLSLHILWWPRFLRSIPIPELDPRETGSWKRIRRGPRPCQRSFRLSNSHQWWPNGRRQPL